MPVLPFHKNSYNVNQIIFGSGYYQLTGNSQKNVKIAISS